jgi:RimJ/RimL family protein N-acetyltransferase
MHVFLTTERLILRRFTEDDAAHLFALDSDPDVMRYVSPFAPPSVEACRERIRSRFLPFYEQYPSYGFWAAVEKASELDAAQVVAVALIDNVASWRVMEKVGMKRAGTFEIPEYGPAVKYALERANFRD